MSAPPQQAAAPQAQAQAPLSQPPPQQQQPQQPQQPPPPPQQQPPQPPQQLPDPPPLSGSAALPTETAAQARLRKLREGNATRQRRYRERMREKALGSEELREHVRRREREKKAKQRERSRGVDPAAAGALVADAGVSSPAAAGKTRVTRAGAAAVPPPPAITAAAAATASSAARSVRRTVNTPSLLSCEKRGCAHAVLHPDSGQLCASGLMGVSLEGKVPGGGIKAQADVLFRNMEALMRGAGGSLEDVYSMECFLVNVAQNHEGFVEVRRRYFPGGNFVSSSVGVSALTLPDALVEVKFEARLR